MREYFGQFSSWDDVAREFEIASETPEPRHVFAAYEYESYEGDALVIFSEDGVEFKMVEGRHCSCYGLEGQFEPTAGHDAASVWAMAEKGSTYGVLGRHGSAIGLWLDAVRQQVLN